MTISLKKDVRFFHRFLFLLFAVSCQLSPAHAMDLTDTAQLGHLTGRVEIKSSESSEWAIANSDDPLEAGDQLRTDEGAEAEIIMNSNTMFILQEESEFTLDEVGEANGTFRLRKGSLLGKVDQKNSLWEFHTPVAVCAVRGTEFILDQQEKDGTRLGVIEGEVEMRSNDPSGGSPVLIRNSEEGWRRPQQTILKNVRMSARLLERQERFRSFRDRFLVHRQNWRAMPEEDRQLRRHNSFSREHAPISTDGNRQRLRVAWPDESASSSAQPIFRQPQQQPVQRKRMPPPARRRNRS